MTQLPRFNIAAVPVEAKTHTAFFKTASGLQNFTEGYCLSPNQALPHATLCQFVAKDENMALSLTKNFVGKEIAIKNTGYYIRKDSRGLNNSIYWSMYVSGRAVPLIELHMLIHTHLQESGIEVLNKSGADYFPHFTLGRTTQPPPPLDPMILYAAELVDQEIPCQIRLGLSDEMGQLVKILDDAA